MAGRAKSSGISKKQIALLHVAKRDLCLTEDDYRAILARYGNCESSADLDATGFDYVMRYFTALGFRSTWTKRTYGNRPNMASPAQVDLIRSLWRQFTGSDDPEDRELNRWLNRFHHVSALRFVDTAKAKKIIPALKAMVARKQDQI
ncbi:hypothetical protein GCM10011491_07310 [Brucella endophytica]|uniref:Regulatory protein GemA n=1 Tax=Brucella endophytica TaxID=1963359 RepID=A0A916WAW9_9HYPH|nr:regulatory protein GemA [Brucella endophytica]GGA82432.1 hypothetical protein GCM10011491_07310 [Brucella endophytica]